MAQGSQMGQGRTNQGSDCRWSNSPDLFLEDGGEPAAEVKRGPWRRKGFETSDTGVLKCTQAHPCGPVTEEGGRLYSGGGWEIQVRSSRTCIRSPLALFPHPPESAPSSHGRGPCLVPSPAARSSF